MVVRRKTPPTQPVIEKDEYVASAVDHRGAVKGVVRSPTVTGAMALADSKFPNRETSITVSGNFTSDGTYWGEGRGRVMAMRDFGKWRVESYRGIEQPKFGEKPWRRK